MAVKFIEPGGDADIGIALWDTKPLAGTPAAATDFIYNGHIRSISYTKGTATALGKHSVCQDAGTRANFRLYINAYPGAVASFVDFVQASYGAANLVLRMTTAGVIQLFSSGVQLGSNGSTISLGSWHRVSIAYTVTSTTVYTFNVWVDSALALTVVNTGTLAGTVATDFIVGNIGGDASFDIRTSDHYVDDSNTLTDPGDIRVTAKRPFANGSVNGFSSQIGSGGSNYGTGHAQQVNERPLSNVNGWSMVGAGSAVTEEYTIETPGRGDMIVGAVILDYMGWVDAKSVSSETAQIIVGGVSSNISLTSTEVVFTKMAGSANYPTGGTDIGIITSTTLTTVSLFECGIVVAYLAKGPNTLAVNNSGVRPHIFSPGLAR